MLLTAERAALLINELKSRLDILPSALLGIVSGYAKRSHYIYGDQTGIKTLEGKMLPRFSRMAHDRDSLYMWGTGSKLYIMNINNYNIISKDVPRELSYGRHYNGYIYYPRIYYSNVVNEDGIPESQYYTLMRYHIATAQIVDLKIQLNGGSIDISNNWLENGPYPGNGTVYNLDNLNTEPLIIKSKYHYLIGDYLILESKELTVNAINLHTRNEFPLPKIYQIKDDELAYKDWNALNKVPDIWYINDIGWISLRLFETNRDMSKCLLIGIPNTHEHNLSLIDGDYVYIISNNKVYRIHRFINSQDDLVVELYDELPPGPIKAGALYPMHMFFTNSL